MTSSLHLLDVQHLIGPIAKYLKICYTLITVRDYRKQERRLTTWHGKSKAKSPASPKSISTPPKSSTPPVLGISWCTSPDTAGAARCTPRKKLLGKLPSTRSRPTAPRRGACRRCTSRTPALSTTGTATRGSKMPLYHIRCLTSIPHS